MARYTGPVCRLCRREGVRLLLKGEKCFGDKCPVLKRAHGPGEHGQMRRKLSEYGLQLREKQKARRYYGLSERQFRTFFERAARKKGVTGEALLQSLELRLDNVVYRLGFGASRREARQLVNHGHFEVNGRKVDIPSYGLRPGDTVSVRRSSRELPRLKELKELAETRSTPAWLDRQLDEMKGTVLRRPSREEIDVPVEEQLIVELYSR